MPKPRQSSVSQDIQVIHQALSSIAEVLQRIGQHLEARGAGKPTPAANPGPRGRKLRLSPARRAALKLQGQYIGHMRGLKAAQKKRVKALKAARGFRAAVALAKKLAKA